MSSRSGRQTLDDVANDDDDSDDSSAGLLQREDREVPLCPYCMTPLESQFDHFCPNCAGPVTTYAATAPLAQAYAEGQMLQKAVNGRPSLIVLLGMWLLLGPQALVMLVMLIQGSVCVLYPGVETPSLVSMVVDNPSQEVPYAIVMELIGIAFLAVYLIILWKVTWHWWTGKRAQSVNLNDE